MATFFEKYTKSEVTNTRRVITTPDDYAKRNMFYAQEAGYLQSLKSHESRRRGLDSYLFMIILSGSGVIRYNGETHDVHSGDCILIDCHGEYSHMSSDSDPWELMWVHYNGPLAGYYYRYFAERKSCVFRLNDTSAATDRILRLIELGETHTADSAIMVTRIITDLLTDSITQGVSAKENDSSFVAAKLAAVISYIDNHYTEKLSLDDLASMFFISKYYLSHAFKKEYKMTIVQYILTRRISAAKEKLRFSDSSIEEIASECGIADASYFNKVFRRIEGMTASQYRSMWKGGIKTRNLPQQD